MATVHFNLENLISKKIDEKLEEVVNKAIDRAFSNIIIETEHVENIPTENENSCKIEVGDEDDSKKVYTEDETAKLIEENSKLDFTVYDPLKKEYIKVDESNKDYMPDGVYLGYEVATYLSNIANSMKQFINSYNQNKKDEKPELSEYDIAFYDYINNLSWDQLRGLINNNELICLDDIPPIQEIGNPIDTYYVILKNTLMKYFYDNIEFTNFLELDSAKDFYKKKILQLLFSKFNDYIDYVMNYLIINKHRELFDILFGKIYMNNITEK